MKKIILKNTKDIKNNKAITLIALVITIVILIILAAVTLNLTLGENGIIARAKQAAFEMKKQEYIEELTLDMTDEKLDRIENSVVDVPLISGIKNRIIEENKDWIDTSKEIIMCDDDYVQHTNVDPDSEAENTILLIPIKDGYEARIRVNNLTGEAYVEDIYKANYEEWNISYSANGGSGTIGNDAPTTVRKGFSFRLPNNTYTPPSMKLFVGWSTSSDGKKNGEDERLTPGDLLKIEEDTTIYAIWKENVTRITFDSNGGSGNMDVQTVEKNVSTPLSLNTFTAPASKFFKGWSETANGEIAYTNGANITSAEETLKLYAVWGQSVTVSSGNAVSVARKTNQTAASLFTVTWGEDGEGTLGYTVQGTMTYKNTAVPSKAISNLSELELGTYTVTCTASSPNNIVASQTRTVNINQLAQTTVTNASNVSVAANAIYNEYDLAYFRDLVNNGQYNINGKLMANMDMSKLCSASLGSWTPIGNWGDNNAHIYTGIFDGDNKTIQKLYINKPNVNLQGFFGATQNGLIKNITVDENSYVEGLNGTGLVIGCVLSGTTVYNCKNYGDAKISSTSADSVGGIVGYAMENAKISYCINYSTAYIYAARYSAGGIAGGVKNTTIEYCKNYGTVDCASGNTGGIVGATSESTSNTQIKYCYNAGTVGSSKSSSQTAGIVGNAKYTTITNCYNNAPIKGTFFVGGILGYGTKNTISYVINDGNINGTGTYSDGNSYVGGITGNIDATAGVTNISYALNTGTVSATSSGVGGISGQLWGYASGDMTLSYLYNSNNSITGTTKGSLIGSINYTSITNSYYTSNLSAAGYTGTGCSVSASKVSSLSIPTALSNVRNVQN